MPELTRDFDVPARLLDQAEAPEVDDLRFEGLPPAERQELLGEPRSA